MTPASAAAQRVAEATEVLARFGRPQVIAVDHIRPAASLGPCRLLTVHVSPFGVPYVNWRGSRVQLRDMADAYVLDESLGAVIFVVQPLEVKEIRS